MARRSLGSALGEPEAARDLDERAQNILDSLKYGHNRGFVCGTPSIATGHWGRVRVLEQWPQEGSAPPFERLASALAGIGTVVEIALSGADGELGLLLGFASAGELRRARLLLAPGTRVDPSPPPAVALRHAVGVTHRPQGVVGDSSGDSAGEGLIDRLEGIGGRWTLFMRCESASMTDVLGTVFRLDALAAEAASHINATRQVSDTVTAHAVSHA